MLVLIAKTVADESRPPINEVPDGDMPDTNLSLDLNFFADIDLFVQTGLFDDASMGAVPNYMLS